MRWDFVGWSYELIKWWLHRKDKPVEPIQMPPVSEDIFSKPKINLQCLRDEEERS